MKSVYIIHNTFLDIVKIGITSNIPKRVRSLECACGVPLELKYFSIPMHNASDIESKMHSIFKDNRMLGEWFKISPNKAITELNKLSASFSTEDYIKELINGSSVNSSSKKANVSRQYLSRKIKEWGIDSMNDSSISKDKLNEMVRQNNNKLKANKLLK